MRVEEKNVRQQNEKKKNEVKETSATLSERDARGG